MNKTGIEYLTHTWNPLAMKCTKVSPACDHCRHLATARRLAANPSIPDDVRAAYAGEVAPMLIDERLIEPLRRKKPAVIGVQFMGDLFHKDVSANFIADVFDIMQQAHQHTFQILTKRPRRMLVLLSRMRVWWPLSNVWLGVTIENQAAADARRADFEATPAAVKFVSYEPALSAVDWTGWEFVSQIISGGETGPGARPSHVQWFRNTRDFCQKNDIAYFHKQNGEWLDAFSCAQLGLLKRTFPSYKWPDESTSFLVKKKRAGRLLDGVQWNEIPEVMR